MESYDKIKKVLALGFMNFLDENKPKDKMCLSNGECADIEEAFNEQDWPKLERYLDKYTESEDERIRKAIIELLKEVEEDETYTGRQHIPDMLSYLEKQKEQKPVERSEEDEKTINELCDIIASNAKNGYLGGCYAPDLVEKLKSLRPQPKQEWSEEDGRILKGIIGKIDHDQTYGVSKDEMLNFLKKL